MHQQEKWQAIIAPVLAGTPFELVGVECVGGKKRTTIRIFIDRPNGGITIDDIAMLSRQISVVLDVEEPCKGQYTLEVSSPGLERPLFVPMHFKKVIGQKIAIKLRHPLGDRMNFKGFLRAADDNGVQLEAEGEWFDFVYLDIEKAKIIPDIKIGGR